MGPVSLFGGGLQDVQDRLIAQNTMINTSYLDFAIHRLRPLNVAGKVKWDHYFQRENQSEEKRNESFLGVILRAEYFYEPFAGITISPKWKQQYARQVPTDPLALQRNELSEIFFLIGTYDLIPASSSRSRESSGKSLGIYDKSPIHCRRPLSRISLP